MKQTFISFGIILAFLLVIVGTDLVFMTSFADGMTKRLDLIIETENIDLQKKRAKELDDYFRSKEFFAHRFIPTDRIEEIETMLHKLNAYISEEDKNEIEATAAEIRARINLLYSTYIYHWYQPFEFRIE
ncbi:MAG: DUF4363 family protein [Clostridia bacterium]|nr:DUF4363 family protein [Clostridia bacterium]